MIENMNEITFRKYGGIIHEGFDYACNTIGFENVKVDTKSIISNDIDLLISMEDSYTLVDIVSGIGLLCVSDDPLSDEIKIFLLDKTVYINEGVFFNIFPLDKNCVVKMAYKENPYLRQFAFTGNLPITKIYSKVKIDKIYTLFYQEKERGFIFKGEKHDFWELAYVDNGTLYSIIDQKGYVLNQEEVMFFGKNQHHMLWADTDTNVCFITITFDIDIEESSYLINKKFHIDMELKKLLARIMEEKQTGDSYAEDLILCYLKEFIIKLIRTEKQDNSIKKQGSVIQHKIENSIVSKSIEYIHRNIGNKFTIHDIARSIPISSSYLSRIFKKHMNMTLIDYVNNYRLERSKDLIRTGEYTFTEIAEIIGYSSIYYFSNQFKLKYGISPSTYSKVIKK